MEMKMEMVMCGHLNIICPFSHPDLFYDRSSIFIFFILHIKTLYLLPYLRNTYLSNISPYSFDINLGRYLSVFSPSSFAILILFLCKLKEGKKSQVKNKGQSHFGRISNRILQGNEQPQTVTTFVDKCNLCNPSIPTKVKQHYKIPFI